MNEKKPRAFIFFLKIILSISTSLFCQQGLANICVYMSSAYEMFGSVFGSDVFTHGYNIAFRDNHFSDYRFFSGNPTEFATRIQQLLASSCSVVLGISTSRECLLAGPMLKQAKAVGISPICGHDDVGKFYPYLFTATHPISVAEDTVVDYINKMPNAGKIFAIHQPTDIYSEAEFSQFTKKFSKPIIKIPVSLDSTFDVDQFSYKKDTPITLVFFTYPLLSVKILIELSNRQLITKKVHIIGASSWNDDVSLFKHIRPILESANSVVAADIVDWKKIKHSTFSKMFVKRFHREPLNIEVLNYDIAGFAVECYKEAFTDGKYDVDKLQYCITHTKYHGVSGTFSFSNHSSFADRPKYLTNLLDRM